MKKILLVFTISIIALGIYANPVYPPTLMAPADNAIGQMPDALLNWGAVAAAVSYKLQVDKDPGFNTADLSEFTTNLSAANAYQLNFGDVYYWRVKSFGVADSSDWSDTWSFSVIDTVRLNKPVSNSGVAQMPDVKLEWYQLTGVSFYDYEIDTLSSFDSPALQDGSVLDTSSYVLADQLLFDAKYYWRIRAKHTANNFSLWCTPRNFITIKTVSITKPNAQATNQDPNVQLIWKEITGINFYEYELSKDSLFTNPFTDVTDSIVNNTKDLSFGTKYYFRVRAVHDNDESPWTDQRYFTTVEKVTLNSPADGSTNVDIRPMMEWGMISGLTSYQLQYADNPAFNNAFDDIFPGTQTQYQVEGEGLDSANIYYWRVRAIHSKDTSDWSEVWNYKIAATSIDEVSFDESDINIYPNPASDKFSISINTKQPMDVNCSIMDLLGQVMINKEIHFDKGENTREIRLQNLSDGIYLIKLQKGSEQFVSKIVIDK